jgi:hypothetical protein
MCVFGFFLGEGGFRDFHKRRVVVRRNIDEEEEGGGESVEGWETQLGLLLLRYNRTPSQPSIEIILSFGTTILLLNRRKC